MQGLVSYGNSPSPTPSPPVRSSKLPTAQQKSTSTPADSLSIHGVIKHAKDRSAASSSSILTPPANKPQKHGSAARNAEAGPSGSKAASLDDRSITNGRPSKKRRTSPTSSSAKDHSIPSKPLPQNLTHTSQSSLPTSELAHEPVAVAEEAAEVAGWPGYPGLSDDEVFRLVTAPRQIEGLEDWGIPRARPQEDVDPALQARVTHFLKLKDEQGEHINTRLLGSSAFANPRIYSQLIDFVSISEHTSAFPAGGWLTRRNIEAEIPTHGPAALDAQQRALADAAKRSREAEGTSRQIGFVSAKKGDQDQSRPVKDGHWDGRATSSRGGSRESDAYKARDRQRERERERDRYRGKDGSRGHPRERY